MTHFDGLHSSEVEMIHHLETLLELPLHLAGKADEAGSDPGSPRLLLTLLAEQMVISCRAGDWEQAARWRGRYLYWWRKVRVSAPDRPPGCVWNQDESLCERIGHNVGSMHSHCMLHGTLLMENFSVDGTMINYGRSRSMDPASNAALEKNIVRWTEEVAHGQLSSQAALSDYPKPRPECYDVDAAVDDLTPLRYQLFDVCWNAFTRGYLAGNAARGEETLTALASRVPESEVGREWDRLPSAPLKLPHFSVRACGYALRHLPHAAIDFRARLEGILQREDLLEQVEELLLLALETLEVDAEIHRDTLNTLMAMAHDGLHSGQSAYVGGMCDTVLDTLATIMDSSKRWVWTALREIARFRFSQEDDQAAEALIVQALSGLEMPDDSTAQYALQLLYEALRLAATSSMTTDVLMILLPTLMERTLAERQNSYMQACLALEGALLPLPAPYAKRVDLCFQAAKALQLPDQTEAERRLLTIWERARQDAELAHLTALLQRILPSAAVLDTISQEKRTGDRAEVILAQELTNVTPPEAEKAIQIRNWERAAALLQQELERQERQNRDAPACLLLASRLSLVLERCLDYQPERRATLATIHQRIVANYAPLLLQPEGDTALKPIARMSSANNIGFTAVKLHDFLPQGGDGLLRMGIELLEMALHMAPRETAPRNFSFYANNLAVGYRELAHAQERDEKLATLLRAAELHEQVVNVDLEFSRNADPWAQQLAASLDIDYVGLGMIYFDLAEATYDSSSISYKPLASAQWLRKAIEAYSQARTVAQQNHRHEMAATAESLLAQIYVEINRRYLLERQWAGEDLQHAFYDWMCAVAGGHINTGEFLDMLLQSAVTYAQSALSVGIEHNPALMLECTELLMRMWSLVQRPNSVSPYLRQHTLLTILEALDRMEMRGAFQTHSGQLGKAAELHALAAAMWRVEWYQNVTHNANDLQAAHEKFDALARTGGPVARALARPRARWLDVQPQPDGIQVNGLFWGAAPGALELRIPSQRRRLMLHGIEVRKVDCKLQLTDEARRYSAQTLFSLAPSLFWNDVPSSFAVASLEATVEGQRVTIEATRLPLETWDCWLLRLTLYGDTPIHLVPNLPFLGAYDNRTGKPIPEIATLKDTRQTLLFGSTGITLEISLPESTPVTPDTVGASVTLRGNADTPEIEIAAREVALLLKTTPRVTSSNVGFCVQEDRSEGALCSATSFLLAAPSYAFPEAMLHRFSPLFFFRQTLPEAGIALINELDLREIILVGIPDTEEALDAALEQLFDARREVFLLVEEPDHFAAIRGIQRLRATLSARTGADALLRGATTGTANFDPLENVRVVVVPHGFEGAAAQMLLDLAAIRRQPLESILFRSEDRVGSLNMKGNPDIHRRETTLLNEVADWEELTAKYAALCESPLGRMVMQRDEISEAILNLLNPRVPARPILCYALDDVAIPALLPYIRHFGALPVPATESGLALIRKLKPEVIYAPASLTRYLAVEGASVRSLPDSPQERAMEFQKMVRDAHNEVVARIEDTHPHLQASSELLDEMKPSEYVVLALNSPSERTWAYIAANYAAALGAPLLLLEELVEQNMESIRQELRELHNATWHLSEIYSQSGRFTFPRPSKEEEELGRKTSVLRDVVMHSVRALPDLLRTVLGGAYAVLDQMDPTYVSFVSALTGIPIELAGNPPLATRFAVGRLSGPDLTTTSLLVARAALGEDRERPSTVQALLVEAADALPTRPLPEARREVTAIFERLSAESDIRVQLLSGSTSRNTFLRDLQTAHLVHFAGHGIYNSHDPAQSGLLFIDGELRVHDLQAPLQGAPIIFSNACETGRLVDQNASEGERSWQGLAAAFIVQGAVNYLGSLWPIMDASSRRVAEAFYTHICHGVSVGEGLRRAREEAFQENDPTWAAFTLFGCPRNRLRTHDRTVL